jgi:phospholipid/cholesterol/gamma-HCH transport system substrate-binding protein
MRGVNIGRVHEFSLVNGGVTISLEIEGEWQLPSDSQTRLAGTDLLGGRTVEILPGSSSVPLPAGGMMPGVAVAGIMEVAEDLGIEAQVALGRVRALLDEEAVMALHQTIDEMGELIAALTEVTLEQRAELAEISSSLGRSAGRVEEIVGNEALDRSIARTDSTLVELQTTGENLARASASLETILARIEAGEGTLGRLATEDGLYDRMDEALEELLLLARDIRENPDRYINISIF